VDTLNDSPDAIVAVASVSPDAGTDPVAASHMQPNNDGAARVPPRFWTAEEDTKLTTAVETTRKKKYGKEYKPDWAAIALLVPGRTRNQCYDKWHDALHPKSDEMTARKGEWTTEEDVKLTDAVEKYNGKNWVAISALVPGRTRNQCCNRWHHTLHLKSDETNARKGTWTTEENFKLKDAVEKHNGKDWAAISALVPGRTKKQCREKWWKYLGPRHNTITEKEHGTTNDVPALG
jgi:myb proto-oncogene protein